MKTAEILVLEERKEQVLVHGYTKEHDDSHASGELCDAALNYVLAACKQARGESHSYILSMVNSVGPIPWPWEESSWKPSGDPIKNLTKASALIHAEIERLQRLKE